MMRSLTVIFLAFASVSGGAQGGYIFTEDMLEPVDSEIAKPETSHPEPKPQPEPEGGSACCAVEDIYSTNAIVRREQWTKTRPQSLYDDKCYNYFSLLKKTPTDRQDGAAYVRSLQDVYKGGRIVLHHTASSQMNAQDVLDDHLKQNWGDMGYHFYIRKDCSILEGRPLHMMGTHAGHMPSRVGECARNGQSSYDITNDFDFKAIGIVMEGNSNTSEMKCGAALKKLIGGLHNTFGIERIGGHGHYRVAGSGTDCPGDHIKSWMNENLGAESGMKLEGTGDGAGSMSAMLERANGPVALSVLQNQFTEMMGFKKVTEAGRIPANTLPTNDLNGRSIQCTACQE